MDLAYVYGLIGYVQGAAWMFFMYSFIVGSFAVVWWIIPR